MRNRLLWLFLALCSLQTAVLSDVKQPIDPAAISATVSLGEASTAGPIDAGLTD